MSSKDWKLIATNDPGYIDSETRAEKDRRFKKFDNVLRNMNRTSFDSLVEEANQAFKEQVMYNEQLLQAYDDKKLKSKVLIKKARILKKNKKSAGAASQAE